MIYHQPYTHILFEKDILMSNSENSNSPYFHHMGLDQDPHFWSYASWFALACTELIEVSLSLTAYIISH